MSNDTDIVEALRRRINDWRAANVCVYGDDEEANEQFDAIFTEALASRQTDAPEAGLVDEDELTDEIADAISDSFDVDWTARDGARHVVGLLEHMGLVALKEPKP